MYQSSAAFGELIQQDSRTFKARITIDGESTSGVIKGLVLNGGSNTEDDFSIGSAFSQYVEVTISDTDTRFEGHEFFLEMGAVGVDEYIPMGYFTSGKPETDEEQISFTAYDRMAKLDRPCFLNLSETTDTISVLKAIGTISGVPVITSGLSYISMTKPVGYTCREVLSFVAQMYGGFAICNRSGHIEIKTYQDSGYTVPTGRYWDSFTHNDYDFVLDKLTCYTGKDESGNDISISVGSGTREVSFSNPFMTQAMLDKVWLSLKNYTYMPGSLQFLGDPRIDPWDILTVEDRNGNSYKVPVMKITMEYDGGLSTSVEAVGKSEAEQESGFQGPTAQMMDRYYAQLVVIDHALVNKIDADVVEANYVRSQTFEGLRADFESTKTRYLEFESATGNDLTLIHGNIETLEGDYAKFKTAVADDFSAVNAQITNLSGDLSTYKTQIAGQFTAFEADITSLRAKDAELETAIIGKASVGDLDAVRTRTGQLEADYSKLNTLVNGNLTSANIQSLNLTAANTTIENGMIKNAMIESLAFDKITGIDVNTTKLTVHSEDGRSTWIDNTIQISDANRVRVQMGKDASGDYTLAVWDAAGNLIFDALGATENTIQRKIIRDAVIADDAAIAGSKLDIESVVREVNGATTKLKSTTILLDDKNQTLDVAFSTMESTVSENSETLTAHTTKISTVQGQISSLIAEDTTIKGNYDALVSRYNSTVATVDSMQTTIGEHTALLDSQSSQILVVQTKTNTIESDLSGTKQTVSAIQTDLTNTTSRVTTVETGLDGLKTRVSATETAITKKADGTTVDSLTSRVATAESTLTGFEASLTATNREIQNFYYYESQNLALLDNCSVRIAGNWGKDVILNLPLVDTAQINEDGSISGYLNPGYVVFKIYFIEGKTLYWNNDTRLYGYYGTVNIYKDGYSVRHANTGGLYYTPDFTGWGYIAFGAFSTDTFSVFPVISLSPEPSYTKPSKTSRQRIDENIEVLSTHDTRITANENSIKLKVSTSDYEAYKTTINDELVSAKSRLTTAESSITTMQGQIALKVEQTDIDTAVQGIQVGGRNLARNTSSEWSEWWTPAKNSSNSTATACYAYLPDVKSALDEYALSIEIEFSGVASGTGGKFYFYSQGNVDGSWGISNIWGYGTPIAVTTPPSDGIYRYTCVNKLNSSAVDAKKFAIGFRADYWDGKGKLRWRKVKVEKGNRATDWTPAPEDIDSSISAVDAKFANYSTTTQMTAAITAAKDFITASVSETYATKTEVSTVSGKVTSLESWKSEASQKITKDGIVSTVGNYYALQTDFASAESRISSVETVSEQTATKFTWIVKSGTSATDFTLTDRTATLVADAINLKGLVTFSGLNSDTQSKINIAQSTADTAKANAATAQSTADTALTNANSAKAWTDANGANMTSMLSMVKKWTGNAVSDTTRINGGWIDTNTVTADKIAIGDFTNYASWKEKTAATCPFDTLGAGWSVDTSVYRTNTSCYKFTASSTGISTMGTIKIPVNVGESFYLEFYYKTDSGWTCETGNSKLRIGSASGDLIYAATILSSGSTSWTKVSGSFSIDASNATPYLLVTISMNPTTTGKRVWIDDIVIRKKTSGELIVDGSITASKIASKSITAEKIDVSDLFAQDITATGTIRGVKLVSATGSIGDLTVNSNGLAYGSLNFSSESKFTLTKSTLQYGDFKINSAGVSVGSSSDGTFNDWPFKVYYTFQFRDYSNTMRTPIASASSTGGRVAVISSQSGKIKVSADWGNTTALSNAYISIDSSDIRLKDNIRKSTVEALPVIKRMQLYEFDWKQDRNHQKIGFVADYLEEIDSRLTVGGGYDEDGRMDVKSVDSFYMLGYAMKGIQELCDITSSTDRNLTTFKAETQSRIAALESRTESLQYQLQQAYTRIAELEKQLQASG